MNETDPCACSASQALNTPRRRMIKIAAVGLAAPMALAAVPAHAKPAQGDRLVEEGVEGAPNPLRVADIPLGKPVLSFPFDAKRRQVRDDTRLNKILLIRFKEAELDPETRARSAAGVLAFSAICTHQGCDLKTWSSKEQLLVCFCHSSKFRLLDGGTVASGPAQRSLPTLPLKLDGDYIVIAGGFSAPPGGQPA